jgi:hypothetical protein
MPACICCRSANAQFIRPKVPNGLPAQTSICGICSRHLGAGIKAIKKRDQDHYEQWQYDTELLLEQDGILLSKREGVIVDLRARISQLQEVLIARPVRVVSENLDQETVNDALQKREEAFRSRDAAYQLMAQLRGLHHDTGRGVCKCRDSIDKCAITKILNSDRSFLRWESREYALMRRGCSSALPSEHPARTSPRWSPVRNRSVIRHSCQSFR